MYVRKAFRTLSGFDGCLTIIPIFTEIQPAHPKGDQAWVFIGRTEEAETPILWPPDAKS